MAEVSRKRGLRIVVDADLYERLSPGVLAKLNRMLLVDAGMQAVMREKEEAPPARKQRGPVQGPQTSRIKIKFRELFPDGLPSPEQLADSDFVKLIQKAP